MTILIAGLMLLAVMAAAWLTQRLTGNVGWVDVYWTLGSGAAGVLLALTGGPQPALTERQILVAALAALWSLRLGVFVALRVARSSEDARYVELKASWGAKFHALLLGFVLIQAPAGLILAVSIMLAAHNRAPGLGLADLAGAAILLIAIAGETLADEQLQRFRTDPANKGKICDKGLWSWSRHPNYFFEWFGWLAYPVIALGAGGVYGWGWAALAAPALMYLVLDHGTGAPPLEAHMAKSRGAAFAEYKARVSRFFPLPPRKHPS